MGNYHGKNLFNCFLYSGSIIYKNHSHKVVNLIRYPPFSEKQVNLINMILSDYLDHGFNVIILVVKILAFIGLLDLAYYLGNKNGRI